MNLFTQHAQPLDWMHRTACLLAGFVFTACSIAGPAAPSSSTVSSPIQTKGETVSTPSSAPDVPRDAAELLHRMLALIDAMHRPEDLTPERVTQFIGVPMTRNDRPDHDHYFIYEELTDMWVYDVSLGRQFMTKRPELGFGFAVTKKYLEQRRPPMTRICQLDMAQFHDALLELGYKQVGNTRGATLERQYRRDPVYLNVGYVGESGESLEKISHDCVKSIYVAFDATPEESTR